MDFTEGATVLGMAAGAVSRLLLPSLREAEVGREYEGYTITRFLLSLFLNQTSGTGTTTSVVALGLITQQEDVAITAVDPAADPHADWMWWETFVVGSSINQPNARITRDIRSQRRARGGDSIVHLYAFNRGGETIDIHRSGRMLVKRA